MQDSLKEIRNLEDKYGPVLFRMGLSHLMDVGHRNLDDASVEEGIKQIMAKGEEDKASGKISVMTPEFQCEILRCAAELAKFGIWDLFRYIKYILGAENFVDVGFEAVSTKADIL